MHGLGVFSSGFVPVNAKIWIFHSVIDREISRDDLRGLPPHVVSLIERHAEYLPEREIFRLSGDGDHFMNHADDPNVESRGDEMFACRDIQPGEELFVDYRVTKVLAFDPDTVVATETYPQVVNG